MRGQSFASVSSYSPSSAGDSSDFGPTEQERRTELAQQRRDAEKLRRQVSRATIPVKNYSDEERAASRFKMAHDLYRAGQADASRATLTRLVDEFGSTEVAAQARITLARF